MLTKKAHDIRYLKQHIRRHVTRLDKNFATFLLKNYIFYFKILIQNLNSELLAFSFPEIKRDFAQRKL